MTFLQHSHATEDNTNHESQTSWISSWLKRYAQASLTKYEQLEVHGGEQNKVTFSSSVQQHDKMELVFDDDKAMSVVDKLSQVTVHLLDEIYFVFLWFVFCLLTYVNSALLFFFQLSLFSCSFISDFNFFNNLIFSYGTSSLYQLIIDLLTIY